MYLSRLHHRKGSLIPRVEALRMAETRRACPHASGSSRVLTCAPSAIRIGGDIINNVVGMIRIARNSPNPQEVVQPQIENAIQLLQTDLRGIWPQLQDMIETHFGGGVKTQAPRTPPDFARQRRELLQSIQLALAERSGGDVIAEQMGTIFRETSDRLRIPAGVAAAGGLVALVAAMSSAAVADVTGVLAASAAIIGTFLARRQRGKILRVYAQQMDAKRTELVAAIENQISHAIDLFYGEINAAIQPLTAFCTAQRAHYQQLVERVDELDSTFEKLRPRVMGSSAE